jgi:hypothetical protein
VNDGNIRGLAEFCVGILHFLFDYQPEQGLGVGFFAPGPDLDNLPKWETYGEFFCLFIACFHEAMAHFHECMAIESTKLSKNQKKRIFDTCAEMESVIAEFPAFMAELKKCKPLDTSYLQSALNNVTELEESLIMLRHQYCALIYN